MASSSALSESTTPSYWPTMRRRSTRNATSKASARGRPRPSSCAVRRLEAVIDNRGKCWAQHHPIHSGKAFRSFAPDGGRPDTLIFIMRASSTSHNVGSFDVSSPAPWPQSPNREFRDVNPQVVVQELDCWVKSARSMVRRRTHCDYGAAAELVLW